MLFIVFLFGSLYLGHNTASNADESSYAVFDPQSVHPRQVCSTPTGDYEVSNVTRLSLVDRHGPCSPIAGVTRPLTFEEILENDQLRVDNLLARMPSTNNICDCNSMDCESKVKVRLGKVMGTGNYVVTVGLGTPPRLQTLELDTGSDTAWVQHSGCTSCYPQKEPKFNPSQSSSFRTMPYTSPSCKSFKSSGQWGQGNACSYMLKYADGSLSTGIVGQDVLTLGPRDSIPSFAFGCGLINKGMWGGAAGLMGLGRGPTSLVSQAGRKYNLFSYCIPRAPSSVGFLNLGGSPSMFSTSYTPMVQFQEAPSLYCLSLTGISVNRQPLSIPPATFSSPTIMDSGAVVSRLPTAAYAALRSAFLKYMTKYARVPGFGMLDTCFDFSKVNGAVDIPMIELRFAQGASLKLAMEGAMLPGSKPGVGCLAFAAESNSRLFLIGNTQQRGYEVVYDVYRRRIGFRRGAC